MKIETTQNMPLPSPAGKPNKTSTTGTAFGEFLRQRIESSGQAPQSLSPGSLSELQAQMPVAAAQTTSDAPPAPVAKLQQALDLLDTYAQAIGDGTKSLKSIEPTLASLVREADAAGQALSTTTDPQLLKIIQQIRLAAQLEQFRFARGDYVDPHK
jgi:hypothetical protein